MKKTFTQKIAIRVVPNGNLRGLINVLLSKYYFEFTFPSSIENVKKITDLETTIKGVKYRVYDIWQNENYFFIECTEV